MSEVRGLYVGIHFQDEASKGIQSINRLIDKSETNFVGLGNKLDSVSGDFKTLGKVGIQSVDKIDDKLGNAQKEASSLENEVNGTANGFRKFGRVGVDAANRVGDELKDGEKKAHRFNKEVDRSSNTLAGLKGAAVKVGGVIAGIFAVDKIKDFAVSGIELAAGTKALNSQFDQVFGGLETSASNSLTAIANETGILPDRLKGSFTQMAAFAKTTGATPAEALSLTERATLAAADSAAFYDKSIEEVSESIQSFLKGNYENDAALGISATETTRNAKANDLYGKSFNELSEAQKQLTLLAMVEDGNKAAGAIGYAAKEADGYENVIGNLKSAWDGLKGTMMTPFLDTVTEGMTLLTKKLQGIDAEAIGLRLKNGFELAKETFMSLWYDTGEVSDLWQNAGFSKDISDTVEEFGHLMRDSIAGGIEVAKVAFTGLKSAFQWAIEHKDGIISIASGLAAGFAAFKVIKIGKGIFDFFKGFSLIGALTNPIGIAVVAIGGLVAAGVYLYKNFDTIKDKTNELWNKIKENPMLLSVVGPIGAVIGAGISLYQNWDTVKAKASELWATAVEKFAGIKQSVSDFVSPALSWFGSLKQKWDDFKSSLANFKMPEWMSTIGGTISKVAGKVSNFVQGSHATGLESVPYNGYVAELHKGEAVLTAKQSDTLRGLGILGANSDGTPTLNQPNTSASVMAAPVSQTPSAPVTAVNSTPTVQVSMPVEFHINGNVDNAALTQIDNKLKTLEANFNNRVHKAIESIFAREMAGLEG